MKRVIVLCLVLGLIAGSLGAPAAAKKKKKKKMTAVEQKYFLRRDACGGDTDNARLSIEDGEDSPCWIVNWGVSNVVAEEVGNAGGPVGPAWEAYPATDGVPFVLDATKPIAGEITLYGGNCLDASTCAPQGGLAAGNATFKAILIGETGGEEVTLGEFEESFEITPAEPSHTSTVSVEVDPTLNKKLFDAFRIEVIVTGQSVGPGGIEYDDPASFLTLPTWQK